MLSSKTKRELKIDQRKILIDSIEIGIPSPQQILTWGERVLPNGKKVGLIKNSKTVNYKRFTPFRDGLFCERIFGPVTSFVCACGKKQPHNKVSFCEKCEVEYIDQRSRRYRLGYISLLSPVTHIWYLKGRPSYLSLFLGKRKKTILALAYCNAYLVEHGFSKKDDNAKSSNGWLKNKNLAFREEQNLLPLQELNLFYPKLEEAHAYKAARLTGAELCFASGLPLCKTNGDPTYLSTFQKANLALTRQRFGRGKWFTKRSFVSHQDNASCSPRTTPTGAYNCLILSHVAKRKEFRKSKQLQNTISLGRGSFRKSLEKSKEKQCPQRYLNSTFTQGFWAHHLAYKAELCKHRPLSKKMTRAKLCKTKKYKAVQFQSSTYNSKCNYKARTKLLTNLLAITNRRFVRSFALVYNYKCKAMNTKLGFVSKKICNCLQSRALYKICQELYTFNTITSAITKCTVSSYGSYSYTRQHTLPFLPSLVSHFYLRDALLGFIYSLAAYEDFPLVEYCDTHRREPLRDVHRFMAHKTVDSLKKPFSSGVREYIKNFSREIHSLERVRSYKIDLGQARQDLFLPGKKCRFQVTKQVTKHGFVNRSFQGIKSERKMSRHFKSAFLTKHAFGQKKMHPPENQRRLSEDNKKSLLSGLELTAIREILSYTGGGALQQLLQQFNQYDLCKFLFAEAQILRVFYETQISNGLKTEQAIASYEHTPFLQTENLSSVPTKPVQGLPLEMQLQRLQNRALLANNYKCKKICQKLCTPYKASRVRALLTKQSFVQDFSEALLSKKGLYTDFQNNTSDLQKKQILRLSRRIYKVARRLKTTQLLSRNHRKPEWMILSHLPVLPPDLRPILQMSEKVIVASDLNIMYQRVIYRNNRHLRVRFIDFHLVTAIQRLVQDAVDRLIENGKGGSKPYYTQGGRPLKSLSDILKGKKGRFRLNLLGKRVDFSGRSVIVVSPACQIHECGLPKAIALELYHYFLLRQLIVKRHCASIVTAKKMIKSKSSLMWDVLRELMYHHPVLLNRAPTLHRLGIQAFQPKLVLGNAILLHPLVCSGFNADFDGDQMGVHLPLSFAARAESWDLLWSRNNLLSPATGQPMLVPSQDMVLGFYYITAQALQKKDSGRFKDKLYSLQDKTLFPPKSFLVNKSSDLVFSKTKLFLNLKDITATLQSGKIKLHQPVWVHWNGKIESEELSQKPLEIRVQAFGLQQSIYERYVSSNVFVKTRIVPENDSSQTNLVQLQKFGISAVSAGRSLDNDSFLVSSKLKLCCVRTTAGRVLMNNLILMSDKYKSCTYKAKLC